MLEEQLMYQAQYIRYRKKQFLYPCNYPGEGLNAEAAHYTHHSEVTNHLLSSKQSTINI